MEKLIKNTKVQYELIKTENKLIEEEVKSLETEDDDMMNEEVPSLELYEKLKRECECL